jgi:tetratricopeptide (TPR) repeat protein
VSVLIKSARLFSQIGNEYGNPDYNDSGEPEKALPLLLRSLTIRENLFLQDSANVTNQTNVAVSLRDLAEIYSVQDEYGKAKELLQKALAIHENLAKQDSGNYLSEAHLGFCLNKLGTVLMKDNQFDESLKLHERAVKIYEKLSRQDPNSIALTFTLGVAYEDFADVYVKKKQFGEALKIYQRAFDLVKLSNANQTSFETNIAESRITLNLGKTKQNLSQNRSSYCKDFQDSSQLISKVKNETRLSPTNTAIYEEVKKLTQDSKCK